VIQVLELMWIKHLRGKHKIIVELTKMCISSKEAGETKYSTYQLLQKSQFLDKEVG
jgi:hypothetical protein